MADRAPVAPIDGIVVLELTLENGEARKILSALLIGAAAWELVPGGMAQLVGASNDVVVVRRVAEELRSEIERVKDEQNRAHRERNKALEKQTRERAKGRR